MSSVGTIFALTVFADGGSIVFRKDAGPFTITLLSNPSPARVGNVDLSVMVQNTKDGSAVTDARVLLHLYQPAVNDTQLTEIAVPATHQKATNKLLYAGTPTLARDGSWRISADVTTPSGAATVGGTLQVLPPAPKAVGNLPYIIVIPLIVILFAVNRWIRKSARSRSLEAKNRRARP